MASRTPPTKKLKLSDGKDRKELCTPCQFQEKKSPAVFECTKCVHYFLCKQCQIKHNQSANTKDHVVVPLDQASQPVLFCPKHPGRCMNSLCADCDKPICDVCRDIEHFDHSLKSLDGITKEISEAMEPLISSVSEDFDQEIEAIKSAEDSIIKKVESHAEGLKRSLVADIEEKKDQVISEIKNYGCEESSKELTNLRSVLGEVLRRGEEAISSKIENVGQYDSVLETKADLEKARAENTSFITKLSGKCKALERATFIPSKFQVDNLFGDFVIAPAVTEEKVLTMKQLDSWTLESCRNIGRVVLLPKGYAFLCSTAGDGAIDWMHINTTGQPSRNISCFDVVNLFVTNDLIGCVESSGKVSSLPLVDLEKKAELQLSNRRSIDGYFCAETREGNYVVVGRDGFDFNVMFKKASNYLTIISNLRLYYTYHKATPLIASTSIGWVKSLDMLLIHDVQKGEVRAYTLEVQNEMKTNSALTLKYSFEKRPSISSPLPGFYIVETYCTDNRVYLYLRKGTQGVRTIKAAPVKIYEARYRDNRWEMTSLRLVKPDGEELCSLEKDQQMKIAATDNKLLCLVYKPAPLGQNKESLVPRMDVTCYVGSKAGIPSPKTHACASSVAGTSSSSGKKK